MWTKAALTENCADGRVRFQRCGVVCMEDADAAQNAINTLNGVELDGYSLVIKPGASNILPGQGPMASISCCMLVALQTTRFFLEDAYAQTSPTSPCHCRAPQMTARRPSNRISRRRAMPTAGGSKRGRGRQRQWSRTPSGYL